MERRLKFSGGFTLIEALVAAVLLVVALAAGLGAFTQHQRLVLFNQERTRAIHVAQSALEDRIAKGLAQVTAETGLSQLQSHVEAPIVVGEGFSGGASGQVQLRDVDGGDPGVGVAEVRVVVCWRSASEPGGRLIGEDANLNGQLDNGEDANGNGIMDSPAMVLTRLAERS